MSNTHNPNYGLIVGDGRSGSNWLLTMLNTSPVTHCRNEPQDIATSPYNNLPTYADFVKDPAAFGPLWDAFARWTASHIGERDLRIESHKDHIHRLALKSGLAQVLARPKLRRGLRMLAPAYRTGEWPLPRWMGSRNRLASAYAIFKINGMRAWMVRWVAENRPDVPILHIIRHPGGQLNSGINRFFSKLDAKTRAQERLLYQGAVGDVLADMPKLAAAVPDPAHLDLNEAVAWFWRVNNEAIWRVGQTAPRYKLVIYEQLAADPVRGARDIYEFLGLPFGPAIEARVGASAGRAAAGDWAGTPAPVVHGWKQKLAPAEQALAATVLDGSPLARFWSA